MYEFTRREIISISLSAVAFVLPGCSWLERRRGESIQISSIHIGNRDSSKHTIQVKLETDDRVVINKEYQIDRRRGDVGEEILISDLPQEANKYHLSAALSADTVIESDLWKESSGGCINVRIQIFDSNQLTLNLDQSDSCK